MVQISCKCILHVKYRIYHNTAYSRHTVKLSKKILICVMFKENLTMILNMKKHCIILSIFGCILITSIFCLLLLPKEKFYEPSLQQMTLVNKSIVVHDDHCPGTYKTYSCFIDFWYYLESNTTYLNATDDDTAYCFYGYDPYGKLLILGEKYLIYFDTGNQPCVYDTTRPMNTPKASRLTETVYTKPTTGFIVSIVSICICCLILGIDLVYLQFILVKYIHRKWKK